MGSTAQPYRVLWSGDVPETAVLAVYDERKFSAAYSPSDRALIDGEWQARKRVAAAEGRNLYNSRIFRLAGHAPAPAGGLILRLGLTDYRDYVATRSPDRAIARADPIGTCVIPVTADGLIPLGRRAQTADVNPGKLFTFGGFFDADNDVADGVPDIFACIRREVGEELGTHIALTDLNLIGLVYDLLNLHPELSFIARLEYPASEIRSSGWRSELDELTFVPLAECPDFLNRHRNEFTPTLIGALEIIDKRTGLLT